MKIQPIEFAHKNGLGPCETLVLKYICRWKTKDGLRDLEKAIHCLQLLIEMETNAQGTRPSPLPAAMAALQATSASLGGYIPEDP
jgi:hypothetical protein